MSFMPREVTADPMNRMQQFMDARASVALPPSVQAFMTAGSKGNEGAKLKDTLDSSAVVVGADAELRKAGYGSPEHSKLAEDGATTRGEDSNSAKEKEERKNRAAMNYIRQQLALEAQLAANVERYRTEFEAAQRQVAAAERELEEAQRDLEAAEQRKEVATENTDEVSRETRMAIRDLEGQTIQVDGKTLRLNGSGGFVDEDNNLVPAHIVAEKADGPVVDAMQEAAAMNEAGRMLRQNQGNAERIAQEEQRKRDEAAAQLEEEREAAQAAEAKLKAEQEALEETKRQNSDRISSLEGETIDSGTVGNNGTAPPVALASYTPKEYEAKQEERLEATATTGFVGGQRIEIASLKLGGEFRSAALGEGAAPAQQTPEIAQNNGMAAEASRVALRSNSGMSNALV